MLWYTAPAGRMRCAASCSVTPHSAAIAFSSLPATSGCGSDHVIVMSMSPVTCFRSSVDELRLYG